MTDKDFAYELYGFIITDSQLYRQQGLPIIKNLAIKKVKGIYDKTLALKLWGYLVENGLKKYKKQFPGYYRVDAGTKLACAKMIADEFSEAIRDTANNMKTLKKAGKPWQMRG